MNEDEELAVVVSEEDTETARNLPAVRAAEAMVARGEVTPEEVVAQRDKIEQVMRAVMKPEVHYGRIPGVQKPTLLKPGAEVLAVTLRLAPHYESERIFHDDGHLTVVSRVTLQHIPTGLAIAQGEGLCTSREKKYAYRGSGRVCPVCQASGTIKRSKYAPRESDYPGASPSDPPGWYCHAKAGGCGANFAANNTDITSQEDKPVPNPDLPDTFNTVLKMANKRALVAAILNGTAASDIFTQDVEDDDRQARSSVAQERQPVRVEPKQSVPRSGAEVKAALDDLLGEDEASEWVKQANELKASLPAPTLFQRMCGVVVDLREGLQDGDWQFRSDAREAVQQVFARRLDGAVLPGPPWSLTGSEAEAGTPTKDAVMSDPARHPSA